MMEMMSGSPTMAGSHYGPSPGQGYKQTTVEEAAVQCMRRNHVTDQVTARLWRVDWEPDPQLLASFPQTTDVTLEKVQSVICESLHFDSMDYRAMAITKAFKHTFQWIFERHPQVSLDGKPMWSTRLEPTTLQIHVDHI
jgi:hypothetical protein